MGDRRRGMGRGGVRGDGMRGDGGRSVRDRADRFSERGEGAVTGVGAGEKPETEEEREKDGIRGVIAEVVGVVRALATERRLERSLSVPEGEAYARRMAEVEASVRASAGWHHDAFVMLHRRVPEVGRGEQPWRYCGWLRHMIQEAELDLELKGIRLSRWMYWNRVKLHGYDGEEIPQLDFRSAQLPNRLSGLKVWKRVMEVFSGVAGMGGGLLELMRWLEWGVGVYPKAVVREGDEGGSYVPETDNQAKAYPGGITDRGAQRAYELLREGMGDLLRYPSDHLGDVISEQKGRFNPHAFFPTPEAVCALMASMSAGASFPSAPSPSASSEAETARLKKAQKAQEAREAGWVPNPDQLMTAMDPAAGTGRTLLAMSNASLRLTSIDIDRGMVGALRVNAALYAPWLLCPFTLEELYRNVRPGDPCEKYRRVVPGGVFWGDGLKLEIWDC